MTRDPYSGSAYDPASLHRYNYARSNPANFLDPSGRATLGEYALEFTNQAAKNVAVGAVGLSVNCMIRADAGILYLVGEFSHDNQTVIDAKADFTNCLASVTVEQLTEASLLSWGFGVVFDELGGMLPEALQGFFPRLLSEEEGSIGPRGPSGSLTGTPTEIPPRASPEEIRALTRENESAQTLRDNGHNVEQNPDVPGPKNPDYRVNGETCDCYSPSTNNVRNIWDTMSSKVASGQANSLVINLSDSSATAAELQQYMVDNPIPGLQNTFVIDQSGALTVIQ
jgi:hypothetical protein